MIEKIGNTCTGCYSCMNVCPKQCIHMVEDEEGFWFPEIEKSDCIGCDLCEQHCPVLNEIPINKSEENVKVYALTHKNEEIRKNSSSGGAFSAIAEYVLSKGGVVFGAAYDDQFDVHHICVDSLEDMHKLQGSKYVQSKIGDTYKQAKQYLSKGRLVLFSGTACQTSGLLAYLGHDYDNLITQDLICHGVPSPMAWRKYIQYRETLERSKVDHIFLRDKSFGWHNWHVLFHFDNGSTYTESQWDDMMIKTFLRGKCSRKCCYDCPFKQRVRLADFTLADYWGIERIAPELNDEKGISSVYVNSPKAEKIIEEIRDHVNLQELDVESAVSHNMAMVESEKLNKDRDIFLYELKRKSFDMVSGKYNDEIGIGTKVRWTLRRFLGNKVYDQIRNKLLKG